MVDIIYKKIFLWWREGCVVRVLSADSTWKLPDILPGHVFSIFFHDL